MHIPILKHYRPRAVSIFGADEIAAAACPFLGKADDGARVRLIEIGQKPFAVEG
jgi:hypothetical protein